jgi:hypothetical protein
MRWNERYSTKLKLTSFSMILKEHRLKPYHSRKKICKGLMEGKRGRGRWVREKGEQNLSLNPRERK